VGGAIKLFNKGNYKLVVYIYIYIYHFKFNVKILTRISNSM
jgi:hypothetical protein